MEKRGARGGGIPLACLRTKLRRCPSPFSSARIGNQSRCVDRRDRAGFVALGGIAADANGAQQRAARVLDQNAAGVGNDTSAARSREGCEKARVLLCAP